MLYKTIFLKYIFIPLWFGLLVFPFMGVKGGVLLAIAIFAGGMIFLGLARIEAIGRIKNALAGISIPGLLPGKKGAPVKNRNIIFANISLIIFLIILPIFLNNYYMDVLALAGLLDLGYIAFYAIGAYTYALLSTKLGISFWLALPVGGLFAAGIGFILGIITLRLRGDYLAIVTLGFIHIVHLVLNNWDSLTGGPNGILGIARPSIVSFKFSQPIHFYYLILVITVITAIIITRLNNSRIGRAWIAMREDEVAAEAMGIDTTRMKCLAFSLGAFWAGLAGVFFAGKFAFVSPESFTFFESVLVLAMVVLGGIGSPRRKVELHPEDEKIYLQEMESLYEVEKR